MTEIKMIGLAQSESHISQLTMHTRWKKMFSWVDIKNNINNKYYIDILKILAILMAKEMDNCFLLNSCSLGREKT